MVEKVFTEIAQSGTVELFNTNWWLFYLFTVQLISRIVNVNNTLDTVVEELHNNASRSWRLKHDNDMTRRIDEDIHVTYSTSANDE